MPLSARPAFSFKLLSHSSRKLLRQTTLAILFLVFFLGRSVSAEDVAGPCSICPAAAGNCELVYIDSNRPEIPAGCSDTALRDCDAAEYDICNSTATPTNTPTITPTDTPTPSPSATASITPTSSPTASPTLTPSVTPTETMTPTITPTPCSGPGLYVWNDADGDGLQDGSEEPGISNVEVWLYNGLDTPIAVATTDQGAVAVNTSLCLGSWIILHPRPFSILSPPGTTCSSSDSDATGSFYIPHPDPNHNGSVWVDKVFFNSSSCYEVSGAGYFDPTPTITPTITPTATPTHTPTHTPTNTPSHTPTVTPIHTPTHTPTHSPTITPTNTPTATPTRGGPQSASLQSDPTTPLTDLNTGAGTMAAMFNLSWNYSWRQGSTPNNWDAMWVFIKFRRNNGAWQHMTFTNTGHTAPAGATIDIGLRDPTSAYDVSTNRGVGAFIYKSSNGFGTNTFNGVKLVWPYTQDGVQQGDPIDIQIHAIHMVYVSSETFSVGDTNTSTSSFKQQSSNNSVSISSESEVTVYEGATGYTVPAAFPKGYNDFYIMRYEVNQEQWRNFFNTLPTTGNYRTNRDITSSTGKNSDGVVTRNNISWDSSNSANSATTPDRDSPNEVTYCNVPVNYLSWEDLTAYLDWAGLRPMTELEFEKAARGPTSPVNGEYVWGTASGTNASGVTNGGRISEVPASEGDNVNWSGGVSGPLRGGSFASRNYGLASRTNAGGSYYGALELSGNLWERVVTVANSDGRAFTGAHGDGALDSNGRANVSNWPAPTTASGAGFRGGSFNQASTSARVSDRSLAASTDTTRGSDYGGRGVRTAP